MNRPEYLPYIPEGQLPVQHHKLIRRVDMYCYACGAKNAIFVFDETDGGRDKLYATGFNNFLFRSQEGQAIKKVLVSPFFVSSSVTTTIELADICAGLIRCYHQLGLQNRQPASEYEEWLFSLYSVILDRAKTISWKGKTYNGIYLMPDHCFKMSPSDGEDCNRDD